MHVNVEADMRREWADRLRRFLPGFLGKHPILSEYGGRASTILYGSTTMGIDDASSDLDVWCLIPAEDLAALDARCPSHFFEFELDGKRGHITVHAMDTFSARLDRCHMDTVFHLRRCEVITAPSDAMAQLVREARTPMRRQVSHAFFFYHYVEMRGEHPACTNAIERRMPLPLLLTVPKMLAHALRATMVLEAQPYPSDKWLYHYAQRTRTGRLLAPSVEKILDHLSADHLRFSGPRSDHPIDCELHVIRRIMIDSARTHGYNEPWLTEWYHYMDHAREAVEGIRWRPHPADSGSEE